MELKVIPLAQLSFCIRMPMNECLSVFMSPTCNNCLPVHVFLNVFFLRLFVFRKLQLSQKAEALSEERHVLYYCPVMGCNAIIQNSQKQHDNLNVGNFRKRALEGDDLSGKSFTHFLAMLVKTNRWRYVALGGDR